MKQVQFLSLLLGFGLLFFASCSDDEPAFDGGEAYFPLEKGFWTEYKLDSVIYDDFDNSVTNTSHFLRVEVGDQVEDGVGGTLTELKRFIKGTDPTDEYDLQSVWFAKFQNGALETVEENLRFIKMDLPPVSGKSWFGNRAVFSDSGDNPLNSTDFYQGWEYIYDAVGTSESVGGFNFSDVVKIQQVDEFGGPGETEHFVASEWYARDVGIIKKRMEIVIENCGAPGCSEKNLPVTERTRERKGFFLDLELIDYKQ